VFLRKLGYFEKKQIAFFSKKNFFVKKYCERQTFFLVGFTAKKTACLSQNFLTTNFFSRYPSFLKEKTMKFTDHLFRIKTSNLSMKFPQKPTLNFVDF